MIVWVGGEIEAPQREATQQAIQAIAQNLEDPRAVIVCGTDMDVMAQIDQIRSENAYEFLLVGITLAGRVTWQLEAHHSHFLLVPGDEFGEESAWIGDAAILLSEGHHR